MCSTKHCYVDIACLNALFTSISLQAIFKRSTTLWKDWLAALKLGWPIACRWINEMIAAAVIVILIGHLGQLSLASYRLSSQLDLLVLMIPYSMNIILAILLASPQSKPHFQKLFTISLSVTLSILFMCSLVFWLAPQWLLVKFFDVNTHTTHLLKLSSIVLMISGLSQLFNATRQLCNAALRALGNTLSPFYYSLACLWLIGVGGSHVVVHYYHQGLIAICWCVAIAYIIASLLSAWKLYKDMQ